jgi:hypothetical protein
LKRAKSLHEKAPPGEQDHLEFLATPFKQDVRCHHMVMTLNGKFLHAGVSRQNETARSLVADFARTLPDTKSTFIDRTVH